MIVIPIKTHKITVEDNDLFKILDSYIKYLPENSVIAVSSKIVSIAEGRVVKVTDSEKDKLIEQESEYFLPRSSNKYNIAFSITRNMLVASAGIDESNGNGFYILWPEDPQKTANEIRKHFMEKHQIKNLGVIITDSRTTPLRWGVTGAALVHSGFKALKDYTGTPDIFGRDFEYEKLNIADSLATSATLVMGEGNEQTPLAVINEVPFVQFEEKDPTTEELKGLKIDLDDDIYAPILKAVDWKKGKKSN